ncbi:MAG: hypothetical protein QM757_13730 [Paludibaculum sp.]
MAFLWEQGVGQPAQIWVQPTGGAPRLVTSAPGSYSSPTWAPDGRSIACLRFRESSGELIILPLQGGSERVVAPVLATRYGLSNPHLAWSPRGDTIAMDDAVNQNQPLGIFLVSVGTGQKSRLTKPEDLIIGDIDPHFSPDGSTISFIRAYHRAYQELFTIPTTGGEARKLTSDIREISAQSWSSDNRSIFFASNRGGEFRIWRLEPGRTPTPTGVYAEFPIQFSFSLKTHSLIYAVVQSDPNIWRLSVNPPHTWTRVIASTGQDASPQYSPDGSRVAFRTDRTGDEQIWVSKSDGSAPVEVTAGKLRPSVARWLPDGKSLVFNNSRTKELYIASEVDGSWQVKPFGEVGVHPVYAPDGQWIYAGLDDSIVRFPAHGGKGQTVLQTRGLSLDIAPDGKSLYLRTGTHRHSALDRGSAIRQGEPRSGGTRPLLHELLGGGARWHLFPRCANQQREPAVHLLPGLPDSFDAAGGRLPGTHTAHRHRAVLSLEGWQVAADGPVGPLEQRPPPRGRISLSAGFQEQTEFRKGRADR